MAKKPIHRNPVPFDQQAADLLCGSVATSTLPLAKLVSSLREEYENFPCATNVYEWLHTYPEFAVQYDRAQQARADLLFHEIIELSDDVGEGDDDNVKILRAKLRADARKFACARMLPRKYGDRIQVDTQIAVESLAQRVERLTGMTVPVIEISNRAD